ncbi:hypothetical protein TNCV_1375601 [Trichonephila clavipes]|nr:hypothetical protein TNCV_1375601 [Trichonephila clavipes]
MERPIVSPGLNPIKYAKSPALNQNTLTRKCLAKVVGLLVQDLINSVKVPCESFLAAKRTIIPRIKPFPSVILLHHFRLSCFHEY